MFLSRCSIVTSLMFHPPHTSLKNVQRVGTQTKSIPANHKLDQEKSHDFPETDLGLGQRPDRRGISSASRIEQQVIQILERLKCA